MTTPPITPDLGRVVGGFVILGVVLRVAAYSLDFPIWWDEAFVGVNLLRRGYFDLLRPLDYGQVAPLLFLWAERAAVGVLGFSGWSLRLVPLGSAVASVFLFRAMAGRVIGGRALLLAVAVFAVSVHPIRHAADAKPYASDLLTALVLQMVAFGWLRDRDRPAGLWWLTMAAPIAILGSHPAAFVAVGLGLALVVPAWRSGRWATRAAFGAYGLATAVVCAVVFLGFTRAQAASASPGMREMWARSFPPLHSVAGLVGWLVTVHSGEMLAIPCGGERGASTPSLILAVVGAAGLWRIRRRSELGVILAPLAVAMVAAAARRYPYGGPAPHGSAARVMQYAVPGLCLLIGLGAARALDLIRSPRARRRTIRVGLAGLVAVGLTPIAAGWARPYRTYQAEAAREFARRFWPEVGRGAEVACLRWDLGVAEWDSIRLGVAVMLCNQAIESPSRKAGGPDWSRVSAGRPLRCVLGVAPERDGPEVVAWLARMRDRFDLRHRETYTHDTAEPGRRPNPERFEVFEFVPKSGQSPRPTKATSSQE